MLKRDLLNEKNLAFWVNEKDSPYTEVKRFDWYRGYQVGGRSLTWGRQSYRWSDYDFEANAKEGIAIDWPIRYQELAPWYDHVEKHAGISGSRDGLPQLPDGQFLPPMPLNCGEELLAGRLKKAFGGKRHMIIGRTANATKRARRTRTLPISQRLLAGLPLRRLLQHTVLDAARGGEDREAHPEALVDRDGGSLRQESQARHAACACSTPSPSRAPTTTAKVVFVCASTLNSTWLLMRSATDIWPGGLGSSSGELGSQPHGSSFSLRRRRTARGLDDKYYYGRRPNGIYIPRYRNLFGDKRDYLRGFGYQGSASREGLVAGREGTRDRCGLQGRNGNAGPVEIRRHGFRRDAPQSRQQRRARRRQEGQVGPAGAQDRLRDGRERAPDAQGHDGRHGGDAGAKPARTGVKTFDSWVLSGHGHSRDGHGAHGTRSARPRCSTRTIRCGMHRMSSSPTAPAWSPPRVRILRSPTWRLTARAAAFAVDELNRRNL